MAAADASAPEHDDTPVPTDALAPASGPETHAARGTAVAVWTPAPDAEQLVDQAFESARAYASSGGTFLLLPELISFPEGSQDDAL